MLRGGQSTRDFTNNSISTPYSDSEKGNSKEDDRNALDFTLPQHSDSYFNALDRIHKNAKKVRAQETQQEQTLMEYLPVNERFSFNKEGKVLSRWQERQKDWEKIQSSISKKIGLPANKPLMMTTTDEYREKIEQYDLLQAAIPLEDRFVEPWQMTLRGGGPVRAPVGHIFSGLECIFEMDPPKPKLIRKPKSAKFAGTKTVTFLDQSDAFRAKKSLYEKNILSIRPHNIDADAAAALVVRSVDLFKWAKESSVAYYKGLKEPSLSAINEEDSLQDATTLDGHHHSLSDSANSPNIEFITPREVSFQTQPGENAFKVVSFTNTGPVAITYVWKKNTPVPKEEASPLLGSTSANAHSELKKGLHDIISAKGVDGGSLRKHLLSANRDSFFCLKDSGVMLPSETVTTQFMFSSRAGEGVFNEGWIVSFEPADTVIAFQSSDTGSISNRVSSCVGSFTISLRGICCAPDVTIHKRDFVSRNIDKRSIDSMAFDIINSCVKRVRDPVRKTTLQDRQISYFRKVNAHVLNSLSERFGSLSPLFVTPERLNRFAVLFANASTLFNKTKYMLNFLEKELSSTELSTAQQIVYGDYSVVASPDSPFFVSENLIASIRSILFPEEKMEIFDDISEDLLVSTWNYDVQSMIDGINVCIIDSIEIERQEELLLKKMAADFKQRQRDERKAARATAAAAAKAAAELDPDYDSEDDIGNAAEEEEEEEEEEEPEEEDEDKVKPKHPLWIESQNLLNEVKNNLNLLTSRPIPIDTISDSIKSSLIDFFDDFESFRNSAKGTAQLDSFTPAQLALPQLLSPFTSEEGLKKWTDILQQTTIEPPQPVLEKGKKAPAPPKPKPGTVVGPTPTQIDFFYHNFYHNVRNGIFSRLTSAFQNWDLEVHQKEVAAVEKLKVSRKKLFDVAAVRPTDIKRTEPEGGDSMGTSSTVAFLNFNGDAFTTAASKALSVTDAVKKKKSKAVQPIIRLLTHAPKAIVLFYETSSALDREVVTDKASSLNISSKNVAEEIQKIILDQRQLSIQADEKRRLQQLRKERKAMTRRQRKKAPKTLAPKPFKAVEFFPCISCAELNYKLTNLFRSGSCLSVELSSASADKYFSSTIPIFVVENLKLFGVIPEEPVFVEEMSDDDEAPVPIGRTESDSQKRHNWMKKSPHSLPVAVSIGDGKKTVTVECFCSASAAVAEILSKVAASGNEYLWIEASAQKLFESDSFSALQNMKIFHSVLERVAAKHQIIGNRFVSEELRETFLWSGVLQILPEAVYISTQANSSEEAEEESPYRSIGRHLLALFPNTLSRGDKPKVVAVVGGKIRADKWRVLDQLIDLVDEIFVAGEICLPFIALSGRVALTQHTALCAQNRSISSALLQKARLRGVRLNLPVDLVHGDEPLSLSHIAKGFANIPSDSRGEGADYEGEAKLVSISSESATEVMTVVDGFVYDIGVESSTLLKQVVSTADLLCVWGTVGVCEVSGFQSGQTALVEASNQLTAHALLEASIGSPAQTLPMATPPKDPLRVLLLGESTVEWFARIADSDGELGGDLSEAGLVTYCSRDSAVFCGLLGLYPSNAVNGTKAQSAEGLLQFRTPSEDEWVYTRRLIEEEEEEEEDD